jgi:hypothetical protein
MMPCKIFPDHETCLHFSDRRKKVVLKERRSFWSGNNPAEKLFCAYRIDACVITTGRKCDFLLTDAQHCYLIELKGSDLLSAVEQIDQTLDTLASVISSHAVRGRIVLTRVNTANLRNSKYLKLKKRLENMGGNLKHASQKMEEEI